MRRVEYGCTFPSSRICDRNTFVQIAQPFRALAQEAGGGGSIPPLPTGGGWAFPHNMIDVSVVLESLTEDTQNGIPSGPNPVTRGEVIFH